jgi:N-methylhydantoinase B
MLIEDYALRVDSGGPGRHRGGLGLRRTYRFLADSTALTIVKKTKTSPWGMAGGRDGDAGSVVLRPGTDREVTTGAAYESMTPGDVLVNNSGGGGGWGDPLERPVEEVVWDVQEGYVSVEQAERDYGVVVDAETLEVIELKR